MLDSAPTARLRLAAILTAVVVVGAFVVSHDNWVTRADLSVVEAIAADRATLLSDVAEAITYLGNLYVLGVLMLLVGAVLRGRGRTTLEAFLPAIALFVAAIVDPLAKLAVGRPRPPKELAKVLETATGYPSGHSAQSAAAFLALAIVLGQRSAHPWRWIAAGLLVACLVGISRVVLGVHSPSDVVAGWCLGMACALVVTVLASRRTAAESGHAGSAREG